MATPGSIGDILTTTLRNRTGELADNVSRNNAILRELKKRSMGFMPFDGGRTIDQEINYANNSNATWFAGYETVAINPQETFSMAEYDMKMLAVAVSISGEDMLKNSGKERSINLVASRVMNAEQTMDNVVATSMYSDGTGSGGKEIGGLQLLVADTPTNTVGGISRTSWPFWANITAAGTFTAAGVQISMDNMWVQLIRGNDRPRIILAGNTPYSAYLQSLQAIQRITDPDYAAAGFTNLAYMGNTPVILDGGYQGSTAPPAGPPAGGAQGRMYFLNTNYLHFRPHKDRNMDVMDPDRYSTNQDAVIKLIGWAGNMTVSNSFLQEYFMPSQWISVTPQLGLQAPGNVDSGFTNSAGVLVPSFNVVVGQIAQFRDIGTTFLGVGEFIFLKGVANTILGSWCTFADSDGTALTGQTTLWAGTANLPYPLAVATAAIIANTWGWYQISGAAICATNGTIAAGNGAAWQAAGVVQAAAVATKNVESAIALSANGVPGTNQAIYQIMRPASQTAV